MEVISKVKKSAQAEPKRIRNIGEAILQLIWGIYRKKPVLVDSCVTILNQDLGNQQQQSKQLQKDNNDLKIYLEKLQQNQNKMEEQLYELIEEKEELSQFEIDSDEDMYS